MEVVAEMRDELRVGWMVRRFDADDPRFEGVIVLGKCQGSCRLRCRLQVRG